MLTYRLKFYCSDECNTVVDNLIHRALLNVEANVAGTFIYDIVHNDLMYLLTVSDGSDGAPFTVGIFTSIDRAKGFYLDNNIKHFGVPLDKNIHWTKCEGEHDIFGVPSGHENFIIMITGLGVDSSVYCTK